MKTLTPILLLALILTGCAGDPEYGVEERLAFPGTYRQTWAVAPALNLSGRETIDPLLQADLVYEEIEQVEGLTGVPVNRVAQVYAALQIDQVESPEEAALVCELLGVDALVVPTVTLYDPYDPPKFGVSLQLFFAEEQRATQVSLDARALTHAGTADASAELAPPPPPEFLQASAVYDAREGSTRAALFAHAAGRSDPAGPAMARAYLLDMDRFCGFAYHELIEDLLLTPAALAVR